MNEMRLHLGNQATELLAFLHAVKKTLSARRANWRPQPQGFPPPTWAARGRTVLPLLVYAMGFLIAESITWLLAFALSPKVEGSSPLFIQGAVVVSALLLVSPKRWWTYLALTLPLLPVNAWLLQVSPSWSVFWTLLLLYLAILFLAIGSAALLRRFVTMPMRFASAREVSRFVLCVCGGAVLPACIVSVGRILIFDWAFWFSWETAYFGYILAITLFTPAIVLWATTDVLRLRATAHRRSGEVVFLVLGLLIISVFVFGVRYQGSGLPPALIYLLVPLLLWAAVRFGPLGITSSLALTTLVAIIGATRSVGPFVGYSAVDNVFALQLFLVFVGVPLFFLAAVTQQQAAAEEGLRASETRYRTVMRNLPRSAILLFDAELRHSFADGPGLQLLGLTPEGLEGRTVWEAIPSDLAAALAPAYEAAVSGKAMEMDVEQAQAIYRIQVVPMPDASPTVLAASVIDRTTSPVGMVVLRDITEQRRARDDLVRERTLTAMLAAISQEFRTLAEHSPDVIARLDPRGRFVYVNQAGAEMFGLAAERWVGKTVADVGVPEDIAARWEQRLQDVVTTRALRTFDVEVHAVPGSQVHSLHVRFVPELAEDAEDAEDAEERALRSVLVIATDVSVLKKAEARLAEQASEHEAIVEAQADGVGVYDLQARFVRANAALRDLLGLDVDAEYPSLPLEERAQRLLLFDERGRQLPPDEWPQWRVLRGEIFAGASAMETRVRTLDGRELWISITGAPVRAADGRATGTVLVARDVTARRALERQVAEQAAELEAIFEAMADGVLVHDAQGRVLRVNQAYRDLMGVEADPDHFARSIDERVRRLRVLNEQGHPIPEEHSVSRRVLSGEVVSGQDAQDVQMHTLDGRAIWVNTSGAPIRTPAGQITGVVLISRDVTVRRQLEQQVRDLADELEAILDASPDVIAVFDQDQHIVRANRALRQTILGIDFSTFATLSSQARAEQLHLRDAHGRPLPVEDLPDVRALRGELLVDRTSVDVCVLRPNGRELAANVAAAPVYNREGQLTRAVTVWRDITERRALERQVAEQAAELAAVFAAMTDGVFVLNADGSVSRLNAASHALFGPLPGHGLTNTAEARAQSLDLRDADGRPLRVEQLPTQRVLRGEVLAGDDAVTLQVRTHDGRERTISLTGGPLRDATGQIVGAVGVVRDVTEFQRVQAALAEQERLFRTLVEHSPDIIARFDRGLRYLYVSPAIRQVSPVEEAAYIGKTNAELGWPEAAYASAHRAIEQVFQTGQPETLEEIDASDRDPATARHFRAQILPECAADGRVESVLAVTTDITTLKRTEQALREANASLEAARQAEERRKQIAESLRGVLTILNSTRSPRAVLQYIVHHVEKLLGSAAAVIYGPDQLMHSMSPGAPATTLRVQAVQGLRLGGRGPQSRQRLPFADPAVRQALASAQPVALFASDGLSPSGGASDGATGNAAIPHLRGELPAPYHALLVVPIRVYEGMYGCLLLFYTQPSRFLAEEVALAQAYADQVALAITNARLQGHLEQESAAAERNRLARELHDTVNQEIFSASLIVASLPTVWQTHRAEAETGLQQLHELIRSALAGLRALLLELRPGQLEQTPLSVALQKLGTAMTTRAGVPILVDIEGVAGPEPLMPGPVKVAFYRVAQEALMNAAKYAKAHAIRIRLRTYGTSRLELEVADDGRGFDPEAVPVGHFGVAIMRERAQAVGASVQVRSRAGQGTMVRMTWRRGRSERP